MDDISDIYINGEYFKKNPTWSIQDSSWKADIIFDLIKRNSLYVKQITEVGCGAGGILQCLADKDPSLVKLSGYDISPQAISLAKERENERLLFFQSDFLRETSSKEELILVIDVLEHVSDYYGFLRKLKRRSEYFVFHIPLDLSSRTLLKPHVMLQQRKSVGHLHYFSEEMVWWFLKDTGFTLVDWQYTKPVTDIAKSTGFKQAAKKVLRNISYSINKKASVKLWGGYSLMILAR